MNIKMWMELEWKEWKGKRVKMEMKMEEGKEKE